MKTLVAGLLWFSALGNGLLAGLYFAFSAFIMTSLARLDRAAGISAMNAINVEIVRSLFMPVFLGTTVAGAVLAGLALMRWGEPGALPMLLGGLLQVLGMFAVTVAFNVPLNNALAAVAPTSAEGATLWARYLEDWTRWNHVRTLACTGATALHILALVAR
ncbi:DUF1772 domain-containing protein [Archangium primigenium]|uniref:anthrone oxygenase family protein n=1 Tax=[Archangium] primigenium TaxID=2792470 RepID=UPI0019591885|nr:anthrone oxygenase family protein [Archangium primigenium]MBM7113686.1 DUF1772 domain-containing protein [Archangium primigenium]